MVVDRRIEGTRIEWCCDGIGIGIGGVGVSIGIGAVDRMLLLSFFVDVVIMVVEGVVEVAVDNGAVIISFRMLLFIIVSPKVTLILPSLPLLSSLAAISSFLI